MLCDASDVKEGEVEVVEPGNDSVVVLVDVERSLVNESYEVSLSGSSIHSEGKVSNSHGDLELGTCQVVRNLVDFLFISHGLGDNIDILESVLVLEDVLNVVLVEKHGSLGGIWLSFPVSHQVDVLWDDLANGTILADDSDLIGIDFKSIFILNGRFELHQAVNSLLEEDVLGVALEKILDDNDVVSQKEEGVVNNTHILNEMDFMLKLSWQSLLSKVFHFSQMLLFEQFLN